MKKGYLIALVIVAMLTLLSLAFNAAVIFGLLRAREIALDAVATTSVAVSDARAIFTDIGEGSISYTLEVEQEFPVAVSVPIDEEITIPIQTTIPISTVVTVPVSAGLLGTYDIDVPVRAVIPVDLELTMPVSETIDIVTTVPLSLDVPIEIPLAEISLVDSLEELGRVLGYLEEALPRLERKLADPLSSGEE